MGGSGRSKSGALGSVNWGGVKLERDLFVGFSFRFLAFFILRIENGSTIFCGDATSDFVAYYRFIGFLPDPSDLRSSQIQPIRTTLTKTSSF